MVPLSVDAATIERVASRLSGAAGPSGIDSNALKSWLLHFGEFSRQLREELAKFATLLCSSNPPWASYRALMACRLIALDKQPGTRPVGIGDVFRRLMAKCVLALAGPHATAACGNLNLCAGLKSGVEGAVHAVRSTWETIEFPDPESNTPPDPTATRNDEAAAAPTNPNPNGPTPDIHEPSDDEHDNLHDGTEIGDDDAASDGPFGTLLVDARNGFNELSRKAMLWTVRHRWPAGARFSFNCYRHSALLVVRHDDSHSCELLHSREGVTQGDPLAMVLYGLALVPLAENLRAAVPEALQPWYADDAAVAGRAGDIAKVMARLQEWGPARGYFPEPEKSIFIVRPEDEEDAKALLQDFNFRYKDGSRYVGGFIGSRARLLEWLEPKVQEWVAAIKTLSRIAKRFPQTAYTGLVRSLQMEWTYVQRVIPNIEDSFAPVEHALTHHFLPALLGETPANLNKLRQLSRFPVKLAGLGIPDPVASAPGNFTTSVAVTAELAESLRNSTNLDAGNYVRHATGILQEEREAKRTALVADLTAFIDHSTPNDARRLKRTQETGAWLTALPTTWNDTVLSAEEFCDNLHHRFGLTPLHLPSRCDGCQQRFTVEHALQCKKGGLIHSRHDDFAQEWHELCAKALKPSNVSDEPAIPHAQTQGTQGNRAPLPPDLRGDIGAHGFWQRGRTAIFDVRITDTDAPSYRSRAPAKVLQSQEREKKDKYNGPCREAHLTFTPLVYSVDGLEGKEARAARRRLASHLADKWDQKYSIVSNFIRSRLSIALARSLSRCLRGTRNTKSRPYHSLDWVAGTGLRLYNLA